MSLGKNIKQKDSTMDFKKIIESLDKLETKPTLVEHAVITEKAKSKKQQRFMGMVHAAKKGKKPASKEVAKAAKGISGKEAEKFASTKHKGLPEKKKSKKENFDDDLPTVVETEVVETKAKKQPVKNNPVAKHASKTTSGAGSHTDKKQAEKRGYQKHKKEVAEEAELDEAMQDVKTETRHKVSVTVSDPNHTMVTKRKEQMVKQANVKAVDKDQAVAKAKEFYKKKGFKVHSADYHSSVSESAKPGWMLKADPKLKKKVDSNISKYKAMVKALGDPSAGKSVKKEVPESTKTGKTANQVEAIKVADTDYGRAYTNAKILTDKAHKSKNIDHYVDAIKAHKEALKLSTSDTNKAAHSGHIRDLAYKLSMSEGVTQVDVVHRRGSYNNEETELDEANITTVTGNKDIRPGSKNTYKVVKSHGIHRHESGQAHQVYTVERPNGFYGVLATNKEKTNIVGSTHGNHSKEEAMQIADHYKKHGQVGLKKGWYIGGDKIVDAPGSSQKKHSAHSQDEKPFQDKPKKGVAEVSIKQKAKTVLRKLDPTIKGKLKDRADSEFDFGLEKDSGDWMSGAPGSAHMKHSAHLNRLARGEKPFQDKPKKGVAEGGVLKSIKRGLKGWEGSSHLDDLQDYIRNASDKTLLFLYKDPDESPYKQTPRDIQIKLINRELKRRYGVKPGKQGAAEGSSDEVIWKVSFDDNEQVFKVNASTKQEAIYKATQIAKSYGNPYPTVDWAKPGEQGVKEGALKEFAPNNRDGFGPDDDWRDDPYSHIMGYIAQHEDWFEHYGKDVVDAVVSDMITMGALDDAEDLEDAVFRVGDILRDEEDYHESSDWSQGVREGYKKPMKKATDDQPKNKKKTVKESVEPKLSFREMMQLVIESGGQQQLDAKNAALFRWASRVAASKFEDQSRQEVYAGLLYERFGGTFTMYDVLSETQKKS